MKFLGSPFQITAATPTFMLDGLLVVSELHYGLVLLFLSLILCGVVHALVYLRWLSRGMLVGSGLRLDGQAEAWCQP